MAGFEPDSRTAQKEISEDGKGHSSEIVQFQIAQETTTPRSAECGERRMNRLPTACGDGSWLAFDVYGCRFFGGLYRFAYYP